MLESLKKNIINIRGKRVPGRFLVIESDDWGSIRIPGPEAFEKLSAQGLISAKDPFSKYDILETETDFDRLLETLSPIRDQFANAPVITANTIVCNPDFEKIRASGFSRYHFERFTQTYKNYKGSEGAFEKFQKGIDSKILYPQFHGREHLNVALWLQLLQDGHPGCRQAFDLGCFAIDFKDKSNRRGNLMAAYDCGSEQPFEAVGQGISEGLSIFEDIFGFRSQTAIAPCYVWDSRVEKAFAEAGVIGLQGSRFQQIPQGNDFKKKFHYNGEKNHNRQVYLSRNALFEPALSPSTDWVARCLESIEIAFRWKKPAIIGMHRLNFSGGLVEKNREDNLSKLSVLLKEVLKRWPDTAFISAAELAAKYHGN